MTSEKNNQEPPVTIETTSPQSPPAPTEISKTGIRVFVTGPAIPGWILLVVGSAWSKIWKVVELSGDIDFLAGLGARSPTFKELLLDWGWIPLFVLAFREIAAESYAACLLAQAGYDVLVQYGANQPQYDLVAVKDKRILPIAVKGSQDGGWMLSVKYKEKGGSYHAAIDRWLAAQRDDVIFVFVQFWEVPFGGLPRSYLAKASEVAAHLKTQCNGRGYGSLQEDVRRIRSGSRYTHRIPDHWAFTMDRIDGL